MMGKATYLLTSLKTDRKGVTALEYGVIAAVLVVAVATAFTTFGGAVSTFLGTLPAKLELS
ncbi:Flp family type IVb pilin [Pseudoroseomonas wenyumeiae]|uniref:Flp family type IVb pilin n=1 Tax=Teichococcus wenyumeiae TaxID=2478470 RepID=A0A3A9JCM8_9PROT|nr:Flp family type IVb pilin [Pseudoroseomonas wenyumeiae]RKK03191.1 Flp family type IVb pilin [Pseudoroseomonas wenyumeiae]RMI15552.1 Flp family type IVb pilin [Pseudoroseomonas wenyumeiae]